MSVIYKQKKNGLSLPRPIKQQHGLRHEGFKHRALAYHSSLMTIDPTLSLLKTQIWNVNSCKLDCKNTYLMCEKVLSPPIQ